MFVSFQPNIPRNNNIQQRKNPVNFQQGIATYVLKDVADNNQELASVANNLMHHIGIMGGDFKPEDAANDFTTFFSKPGKLNPKNSARVDWIKNLLKKEFGVVFSR